MTDDLTLSVLQREAYEIAVARGQWPRGCRASVAVPSVLATVARRAIGEETTELAAALSRLGASGSLDPVADELADVVIVCASIAEALGVDLEQAVRAKMTRNAARAKRQREEGDDLRAPGGATGKHPVVERNRGSIAQKHDNEAVSPSRESRRAPGGGE